MNPFELIGQRLNAGVAIAIDSPACEEASVLERIMQEIAPNLEIKNVYTWDLAWGFQKIAHTPGVGIKLVKHDLEGWDKGTVHDTIRFIRSYENKDPSKGRALFILIDIHKLMSDPMLQRLIKITCDQFYSNSDRNNLKRLMLLGENIILPSDFDGTISKVVLELPTPEQIRTEIELLRDILESSIEDLEVDQSEATWTKIVRSGSGLTIKEISSIVREIVGAYSQIGQMTATRLHEYKVEKLKALGVEVALPPETKIGGLDNLTHFIERRSVLLTGRYEDVPPMKGILAVGPPGTGKSLLAKSVGDTLGVPVFKLDMDALLGSLVGESESKTRAFLKMLSASAPNVLWIDEVDKAFAGMNGKSGDNDSGVGRRVFGMILSWMQENKEPVFVVATANNVSALPIEFLRKGRFDEIFRVDLPTCNEREAIALIHLNRWGKNTSFEVREMLAQTIAKKTEKFSGAEIAKIVEDSALFAMEGNRPGMIEECDVLTLCAATQPLAVQEAEEMEILQKACARFVPASSSEEVRTTSISLGRGGVNGMKRQKKEQ